MRIARFFVGSCLVAAFLIACVGGPGTISDDPLGTSSGAQSGKDKNKNGTDQTDPPPTSTGSSGTVVNPPRDSGTGG